MNNNNSSTTSLNVIDLESSFKELQDLSDEQFKTIVELKKQIKVLKEENDSLKKTIANNNPVAAVQQVDGGLLPSAYYGGNISDVSNMPSNEEITCKAQIAILKNRALDQELTLEEAKKLQIYTDILNRLNIEKKNNSKNKTFAIEKITEEELLKMAEG